MDQKNNNIYLLDISWESILKIMAVVLGFYFLYLIHDLLVWMLYALIISVLLGPAIDFFCKKGVPKILGVILIYLGVFGFLTALIYLIVPIFLRESSQFSQVLPQYFERVAPPLRGLGFEAFENIEKFIDVLGRALERSAANIFSALFSIFGGIFSTLFIISVATFISLEEKFVERAVGVFFPKKYESFALSLWERCQRQVSGWFGVRVVGSILVGLICYAAFLLFHVKYPLSLAILTGVLEFIPLAGPLIAALIVVALVSLESLLRALFVLIFLICVQQIEGNILTPILTRRFINLSPALVLVSLVVGSTLFGLWGAILFVPLAGIMFEFTKDFLKMRKTSEDSLA